MKSKRIFALLAFAASVAASTPLAAKDVKTHAKTHAATTETAIAVAPQYDTSHVYVAPEDVDKFVTSFLATFGGKSTKQVVATVTPTPAFAKASSSR